MALVVSNLSARRSGRLVLAAPDFALEAGQALILRGPNGAGKSTLLRVLAGLLPAATGSVALDAAELGRDADSWGEKVAYAGHLDAIKAQLTVRENLAFWAALFGAGRGAVETALAGLGLERLHDRPAGACSAGQKRRLGLARLLVAERRLWLLDEPTVSLDAEATERVAALVRGHCAAGGLALVATHVDLGLPEARTLMLAPPRGDRSGRDPFLAGAMA